MDNFDRDLLLKIYRLMVRSRLLVGGLLTNLTFTLQMAVIWSWAGSYITLVNILLGRIWRV